MVAALAAPDSGIFELAVSCEVFGLDHSNLVSPWYGFKVLAVTQAGGLADELGVQRGHTLRAGGRGVGRHDDRVRWPPTKRPRPPSVLDALRAAHARGARIASMCSGAFVLAAAGLLDGRARDDALDVRRGRSPRRFPEIDVDPDVLYVGDGQVLTSAGTAAGIDLCLHVVRMDHGAEVGQRRRPAHGRAAAPRRRPGAVRRARRVPPTGRATRSPRTLDWALEHLDEPLTVDDARPAARA